MVKKPGATTATALESFPVHMIASWFGEGIASIATRAYYSSNWLPVRLPPDFRAEPTQYAGFNSTLATTSPTLSTFTSAGTWIDASTFDTVTIACTMTKTDGVNHSIDYGLFKLYGGQSTQGDGTFNFTDPPLDSPTSATAGTYPVMRWNTEATNADYDHIPVFGPSSMSAMRTYSLGGIPWIYPTVSHNAASEASTVDVEITLFFRSLFDES